VPEAGRLGFTEKLGYGLGDAASNFFFQFFNIFLLYYYTDVFGLGAAAAGTMFLVTKIMVAVTDPVMGLIADRTRSRWGSFRPYLLWAAVPYALCGYAMFAGPDLSGPGRLVYAYVTYAAMLLAYTAINVPYSALMGVISPSSAERTEVSTWRFMCAFVAAWLIGTFVTPLKNILGAGDEIQGFRLTMAIFAVASVALFWFTFATTRERVTVERVDQDVRRDLRALVSNGPWVLLFAAAVLTLMNGAIRSGSLLFYFKYYVGDDGTRIWLIFDRTAVFMSLGLLAMLLGMSLTKPLTERFEKRNLLMVLTLLNAVAMATFYVIPSDSYWLMVAVNCLGTAFMGPTPALVWAMYADCADYGEWTTGRRTTALVFSTLQFGQKLGLAVGAGLVGLVLGWVGFVANEAQTAATLDGIRATFSLLPAALALLSVAVIIPYRIDRRMIARMEQELAARHGAAAGA
jgi:GPH family glycoside/pentoside/hexuronide:cation symporter